MSRLAITLFSQARIACAVSTILALATFNLEAADAQRYPDRPLRLLAPYGAGGSYDALARLIGSRLGEQLGQQVIVDNRPGAAGRIGMALAIKMPPDGYNLIIVGNTQAVAASVYPSVPYDLARDIVPLSMIGLLTNVLVLYPNINAHSVRELVNLAKAKPGSIRFGSGGTGGITHLAGELFKSMTGAPLLHIPYKSAAQATNAQLGGEVEMNVLNMVNAAPHVRSGRLRGLAVTGLKRSHFLPDLPTLDESGLKGYEIVEFYALALPAGAPKHIVARLHNEIVKAVNSNELREHYVNLSMDPVTMSPEQTRAFILEEQAKYAKIVKQVGIKPE
jgi:tripartite-type tricarboxylate transporter receptor subunit TctC